MKPSSNSRKPWLLLLLCIWAYFATIAVLAMGRSAPAGFVLSLVKPMEDDETYVYYFNHSWAGKAFYQLFQPLLGFHYADALVLAFWLLVPAVVALLFFRFLNEVSEEQPRLLEGKPVLRRHLPFLMVLASLLLIFFSRKLYVFGALFDVGTYSAGVHGLLELARGFYHPAGTWFTRFYQPAVAFVGLLAGLIAVARVQKGHVWLAEGLLLAFSIWVLKYYPWMGITLLGYFGLSALELLRVRRLTPPFWCLFVATAAMALVFLLGFRTPNPDFTFRMGIVHSRWPDSQVLSLSLALTLIAGFFWRMPLGRSVLKLQLANTAGILTPLVLGYHLQQEHHLRIGCLTILMILLCMLFRLLARLPTLWLESLLESRLGRVTLVAVIFLLALREYPGWAQKEYYLVPEAQVAQVRRLQAECGPGTKAEFFFSTELAMYWSGPARSLCRSIVANSWEDWSLSNPSLAATFMAATIHFGRYESREAFLADLPAHIQLMGSGDRQLKRNQVQYGARDRFHQFSMYHLYNAGTFVSADARDRIRSFFAAAPFEQEQARIERMDKAGQIVNLYARGGSGDAK